MFIYWNGYEIDGSDTDFNLVLPESVQLSELAEVFLHNPLIDHRLQPKLEILLGGKNKEISREEFGEKLLAGDYKMLTVTVNCRHPEELPEDLRREIYAISERREPHEEAYGKTENPCTEPVRQGYYTRGEKTVTLYFTRETVQPDEETYGYVTNMEILKNSGQGLPCVLMNVGPGFYYEYAIYLVDWLRERFPSIATFGGLDCEGGWTFGCTYADSLYQYEKVDFPVRYSVKNTLKRLCACGVLCPCIWYYKNRSGWVADPTDDFIMVEHIPSFLDDRGRSKQKGYSFGEYAGHCQALLENSDSEFDMICGTAVRIVLPEPDLFVECGKEVQKELKQAYEASSLSGKWRKLGYFSFCKRDGRNYAQFRISYMSKPYLEALLKALADGRLDAVMPEIYRRRHGDND